jgi:DNA-binding XRE family transcriptional regulator
VTNLPLTQTSARARAAALIGAALETTPVAAFAVADTLDAVSAAVLRTTGLDDDETIRLVLATLWERPIPHGGTPPSPPALRRSDREWRFLRDLGQRIHVLRRARRLTRTGVRNRTGIGNAVLIDIEQGTAAPSVLTLHRLAEAFQVPLPMLVDDNATPLRILRILADPQP